MRGAYDLYGGTADVSLRGAVQIPLLDPVALVPAMADATTHLGFGVTCNLVYEVPFLLARRMPTLDHLTRGGIGWNIVTGYLDSAARAMGFAAQIEHDDRYDLTDEYLQVVYALWGRWHHLYNWLSKLEFTLGLALALTDAMGLEEHA